MAGDFNTCDDSTEFELLKKAVQGKEGQVADSKEKHTSNFHDNDLIAAESDEARRIDFIFSKNESDWDRISQIIYRPTADWRPKGGNFLSDHALVESVFVRFKR
jgi:endonuclease/exonuclease/phosphatase family metal-dependent hydrolase